MTDEPASEIGRYAESPFQIPLKGWLPILKRVYARFWEADISLRCAGVAFYTFFSLFPAIGAVVLTYGLFLDPTRLRNHLSVLHDFIPRQAFIIISDRLDALLSQPQAGLGVGLAVTLSIALWSGSRGMSSMISLIGEAYRETDERSFVASTLLAIGMTLGGIVFLTIALVSVAALPALFLALPVFDGAMQWFVLALRWPVLFIFVIVALVLLYRWAPDRHDARLVWLLPGALFATLAWIGLSSLFSFYVTNFGNYGATFGSLSVAVVMMFWLNYTVLIFATGAMLNAEAEFQTRKDSTTGPVKPMGQRGAVVADTLPDKLS